mmetsp:Transcript_33910/g.59107  ORF Transcript_33910/g.59107 Transcript_33910/m.59107 type:complete len:424 (+) Transcript_33910:49-1320(+)
MMNISYNYVIVNADDHDRIITDPAYRLQKIADSERTFGDVHSAMFLQEQAFLNQNGGYYPKVEYSPQMYDDLIETDKAIRKLDRVIKKVHKYNIRAQINPEHHDRREARMLERAAKREEDLLVCIGTSEKELRYNDYFESDYDPFEELRAEQNDLFEQMVDGTFHFKNYEFVEEGLSHPTAAVMGTFEKKMFRFKHRAFTSNISAHTIREKRMISRFLERALERDPQRLVQSSDVASDLLHGDAPKAALRSNIYREYMLDEAIQQYKDYFESDVEDLADFEYITPEERAKFGVVFTDFTKTFLPSKHIVKLKAPTYDKSKGILGNLATAYQELRSEILPSAKQRAAETAQAEFDPLSKEEIEQLLKQEKEKAEIAGVKIPEDLKLEDIFKLWRAQNIKLSNRISPPSSKKGPKLEEDVGKPSK